MAYCSEKVRIGLGIDRDLYAELIERSHSSHLSYARIVEDAINNYLHQSEWVCERSNLISDIKEIKKTLSKVQAYIKRG